MRQLVNRKIGAKNVLAFVQQRIDRNGEKEAFN